MTGERLTALRGEIRRLGVDAVIVPRADEHLGEYVAARAERLPWLSGFTGSAGVAAVTLNRAAVFSDGRYVLQLAAETDPAWWERLHVVHEPPAAWLAATGAKRIGYDPWLIAEDGLKPYAEAGLTMVALDGNPVDAIWKDQPAAPLAPALPHPLTLAGRSAADKRADLAAALRKAGDDAAVITDPASLAWLFNIRGADVPFVPVPQGFALIDSTGQCTLFMASEKLPAETRAWLGNAVSLAEPSALRAHLQQWRGKRVRVDPAAQPAWFAQSLRAAGAEVQAGMDPCILPKACKNVVEQQGSRNAHLRDAAAVARFLRWFDEARDESDSEMSAASRLLAYRQEMEGFRGESFPAISGAGEHGAVIHYRVSAESNRLIRTNEAYLIDSGAQYQDGTTDITRTLWTGPGLPPDVLRDRYTRVLQGHIAIDRLVFPAGVQGSHLDSFARAALWQAGLDFDHGTGHGVGSYLSVHEGPVSLSRTARPVALMPGMILSNEPGFYAPGAFGIRLENLLLVREMAFAGASKPFLGFETLSWAPFDRRLIAVEMLTAAERDWIDSYHGRVLALVSPLVEGETRAWLERACARL
jgi:Xaa-Pro aminopeptidase